MHAQDFQVCAVDALRTERLQIDTTRSGVLRDQNREALGPLGVPIVDSSQNGVLPIKIVIEYGDSSGIECEISLYWLFGPGDVGGRLRRAIREFHCARGFLIALRAPGIMLWRTVRGNPQLARRAHFHAARDTDDGLILHNPVISGRPKTKFFRAGLIALLQNPESSLVRRKTGIRSGPGRREQSVRCAR